MKKFLITLLIIFNFSLLSAQITGSSSVCENEIVTYYAVPSPGSSYSWSQVGGSNLNPLNTDSLVMQWSVPGTGTVVVLVDGVPSSLTITVNPNPSPQIVYDAYPICPVSQDSAGAGQGIEIVSCVKVCKEATVSYSTALNAGSTYQWFVSGESSITGAATNAVTVTWDDTDFGKLTVVETNSFGCIDSSSFCLEKVDLPVASFTNLTNVCKSASVSFNNLSTGATSYEWDFGDGNTSTAFLPTHSYGTAGTYTITLIVENECHCTDTFQNTIVVNALPGPEISCPSTLCAGDIESYSAAGDTSCTYNWFVIGGTILSGMGTQDVTVAWGAGQLGTLGLTVSGCASVCSDTTLVYIPIIPAVGSISGPDVVCFGECYTFSLPPFSGSAFSWSMGSSCGFISNATDCESIEICWPDYGFNCKDTLKVTFYNEFLDCGGVAEKYIKVRPTTQIFGQTIACANEISYFNEYNGLSSHWSVSPAGPILSPANPIGNVSINWNNLPGNYIVKAVVDDPDASCNDSSFFLVTVVAPPMAPAISGDTLICANSTVSYCTVSTDIVHWAITGGTPSTAIGNCVNVTWNAAGPYLVEAYVKGSESPNCTSSTSSLNVEKIIGIAPVLTGNLLPCANATDIYATSTVYPPFTTFKWTISPANAGAILSPTSATTAIEWGNNAPGAVLVNLEVVVCNQAFNSTMNVNLNPIPTTTVTQIGTLCSGGAAQLSASGGVSYSWSGPGGFSSVSNPTTISSTGLYQVVVTDANGCQATDQITVSPVSGPNASVSSGESLTHCIASIYTNTLCALGNPNYTYLWSNGATTQCINVSAPGTFFVTVTDVTTNCMEISNSLTVSEISCNGSGTCVPNGSVSFTHSTCNPISFTNTSIGATSFAWNFGDGNTSAAINPTHTYTNAGFYYVTLTGSVPDLNGPGNCTVVSSQSIEIPLAANFDEVIACADEAVCFTDRSSYTAGNSITSWSWSFGDGNFSSSPNPCHTYAAGTYTVVLTISDGTCATTFTKVITISPLPVANFLASSTACLNEPVTFTDASTGVPTAWNWEFGDGGTSLNQSPNHSYNAVGTYNVKLLVQNAMGCEDSIQIPITVVAPAVSGYITAFPDTVVCEGNEVLLVAPSCASCTYLWSTGSTNDSISVTSTGIYLLTITDANGCNYYTSQTIFVKANPSAIVQNYGEQEFCLGTNTTLYATNYFGWDYLWITPDFNNGSTNANIYVNPGVAGDYNYQVAITDVVTGCTDTSAVYVVTAHANPVPPVINSVGVSTVCQGGEIMLFATHPDPSVSFLWNTGEVNDTIIVTEDGCYELEVTTVNGCSNSSQFCVTVNPLPEVCAFYEGCFDTCASYEIKGPMGGTTYQWLMNGSPIIGATMQNYVANVSGNYSVVLSNMYGCLDTTGILELELYPCPDTTCAELIIDSVYCNSVGDYLMDYHVVNNTPFTVSQVSLQILPPFNIIPVAPLVTYDSILSSNSSGPLTTVIFGGNAGDLLCFRAQITAFDTLGQEALCCLTDTQCIVLPPCNQPPVPCDWDITKDICVNDTASFTYLGSTLGVMLNWSFVGGSPSSATGAGTHHIVYNTPGTYPVTLTFTNSAGVTSTCIDSITVHPSPVANIVQVGNTLQAFPAGMSYQWYSGVGMTILPGEINQFYTPITSIQGQVFCVVVTNSFGCKDKFCVDYVQTGISSLVVNSFALYPNPNNGSFVIDIDAVKSSNVTVSVVSILGVTVNEIVFSLNSGMNKLRIQSEGLAKGIYMVKIEDEMGGNSIVPIVVK